MTENQWLAERFESNRAHLLGVAYRMLGSRNEADDAVQEAWIRLDRSDPDRVENLEGWLTTVVARICLDMLRSRNARREEPAGLPEADRLHPIEESGDPEHEAILGDAVGMALLVVLESLTPAERVAFVLHDMFAVPFEDIAPIVDRSPAATRQLASRARRRVQGADTSTHTDRSRPHEIVDAFLAASRNGDLEALIAVLDPDIVVQADATVVQMGAQREVQGAQAAAESFSGRARAARAALIDGEPGMVWGSPTEPRVVFRFTFAAGVITRIEMIGDPERLGELEVTAR